MNWDAISTIAEVVSAIAVVVSLIYLAIQLRSNTRALRASGPDADIEDFTEAETAQICLIVRGALSLSAKPN